MNISAPFLTQPIGAGALAKAATSALGIKPCAPCKERARRMNQALVLVPRKPNTNTH